MLKLWLLSERNIVAKLCGTLFVCLLPLLTERVGLCQDGCALLVGISEYPGLGEKYRLDGASNDLKLMRKILEPLGEFEIRELSTEAGATDPKYAPTRANILRELSAMESKVAEDHGGKFVFYFSGHGSQQIATKESAKDEIDNLDEVILPSDSKKVSGDGVSGIPNAITDNEIGTWMKQITGDGGEIWAIFDCCHSGDMARGDGKIRYRFIPSEDLGLQLKPSSIDVQRATTAPNTFLDNVAILYACKSGEKAIEQPIDQMEGRTHGLLTYSLFEVLRKNKNRRLSHREMRQWIYESYVGLGRYDGPTPAVEGGRVDSSIFGSELKQSARFRIEATPNQKAFVLNAGLADGLSKGAVLSVFNPDTPEKILGYVKLASCSPFSSTVKPFPHKDLPAPKAVLMEKPAARIEEANFEVLKIPVGLGPSLSEQHEAQEMLDDVLNQLTQEPKSTLTYGESSPEWFFTIDTNKDIFLRREGASKKTSWIKIGRFGAATKEGLASQITKRFQQIAKGQNLLRVLNDKQLNPVSEEPSLEIEIQVFENESAFRNKQGKNLEAHSKLRSGNVVQYNVANTGLESFDLTVLEVNSRMEISPHFPTANRSNEIEPSPDGSTLPAILITGNNFGRNHLVFIAITSNGETFDLRRLADSDREAFRSSGPASPLKSLLLSSVFGSGVNRAAPGKLNSHRSLIVPIDIVERDQ